jgi:hypothetical protein
MAKAVALCRKEGATLLIAELDRLARNAAFLLNFWDSGVNFVATDMPHADRFTVCIMARAAEKKAELIGQRTREGLAALYWLIGNTKKSRFSKILTNRLSVIFQLSPVSEGQIISGISKGEKNLKGDIPLRAIDYGNWNRMKIMCFLNVFCPRIISA